MSKSKKGFSLCFEYTFLGIFYIDITQKNKIEDANKKMSEKNSHPSIFL